MSTTITDTIEREILFKAPIQRVYDAITQPDQIVKWFPDAVTGALEPGKQAVFAFEGYGEAPVYIVATEPPSYFAYRWLPGSSYDKTTFDGNVLSAPNTLVEFNLEEEPGGTRLRFKESGFSSLPAEVIEKSLADNNEGWTYMFDRLEKFLA